VFDWDSKKAKSNEAKHGVSFEEAGTAFLDPDGLDGEDLAHSQRYTIRRRDHEEVTRIISARRASRKERERYEAEED
jgi:hypothetical protein